MPHRSVEVCDDTDAMPNGEHTVSADIDSVPRRGVSVPAGADAVSEMPHTGDVCGGGDPADSRAAVSGPGRDLSHRCGGQAVNRFA